MSSDAQQRRREGGQWYLHQLTLQLHRFVTTPDDSNREMLGELAKQYQQRCARAASSARASSKSSPPSNVAPPVDNAVTYFVTGC
jgi:hypothetical protein